METDSSLLGITEDEAANRLIKNGPNELSQQKSRSITALFIGIIREPILQLLLISGGVYLILGSWSDALMLLGFALVNILIALYQENRTERVLNSLKDLTSPRALVIRNGARRRVPGREVVPGDLLVISEGDRVPADAFILSGCDIEADESMLTGESLPVRKSIWTKDQINIRPGGDDLPKIFAGTLIVRGYGTAQVEATGLTTEIGKIGKTLSVQDNETPPLGREMKHLIRSISLVAAAASLVVFGLYVALRGPWLEGLLASIALAMSLLPQELPLVITVFMVMGAWRMAQKRVLTRRSSAIETLGAATVLCTDKTGTLTENRMNVAALQLDDDLYLMDEHTGTELPETFHPLIEYAILACEQTPFDPMEQAFHRLGQSHLGQTEHLHTDWTLSHEYDLSPTMRAMTHVWKSAQSDTYCVAAKGAPEAIFDLCHLPAETLQQMMLRVRALAERGMRVLAVARTTFEGPFSADKSWPTSQHDFPFQLIGLIGLSDPIRPRIRDSVIEAQTAGIKVIMVTGDHPDTARAISRQAGIDTDGTVMSGDQLSKLGQAEIDQHVREARVFARILPEQKLQLVNSLKSQGEIVAMTGDGVNDAPALKAAHIGIAMGERGSDVAREAAALVLLDDDFSSIIAAIALGRRIYDNLRKAMIYLLAVHVPIAGLTILPLIFGWPLIFMPIHIVFLEMVIDPVSSLVFEAESAEEISMLRPPRSAKVPLMSRPLIATAMVQGVLVLIIIATLYNLALGSGLPETEARSLVFVTLVGTNFAMIFSARTTGFAVIDLIRRPNKMLGLIFIVTLAILIIVLAIPGLQAVFFFGPFHVHDLIVSLTAILIALASLEVVKAGMNKLTRKVTPAR